MATEFDNSPAAAISQTAVVFYEAPAAPLDLEDSGVSFLAGSPAALTVSSGIDDSLSFFNENALPIGGISGESFSEGSAAPIDQSGETFSDASPAPIGTTPTFELQEILTEGGEPILTEGGEPILIG